MLARLIAAEEFEQFLHTRYIGQKRFSLEGAESMVPLLDELVSTGSKLGVEEMVIGMAHRGRLNVLAHLLHKPYEEILAEFEGADRTDRDDDEGDVKYHKGYSHDHVTEEGRKVHLSLSFNPSHLELVDPVIEGIVYAKQALLARRQRGNGWSQYSSTVRPPLPAKASSPRLSISPNCPATAPAAPSTSSSTISSATPPKPTRRALPPTRPT